MGWLDSYKQKLDDEASKKEAEEKETQKMWERYRKDAQQHLDTFIEYYLKDLVGRKTKDGKTLRIGPGESYYPNIAVYADDEKLASICFYYREGENTDGDGMSWGNGSYSLIKNVITHREYKGRYYNNGKDSSSNLDTEELAHYFVTLLG